MIYLIDLEQYRQRDVVPDEGEVGMVKPVLDVRLASREEVIEHDHLVSVGHETIDEVRADESGPPGDEYLLAQDVGQADGIDRVGVSDY